MIQVVQSGEVTLERVNKLLATFPGGVQSAMHNALKRAGETAKTKAGTYAAEEYTINKGTFMGQTKHKTEIKNAGGELSLNISFAGSVLPLLTFNTRYARGGVMHAQVKRKGGGGSLFHVFTARIKGPLRAYERTTTKRFPLEAKFGPSTAHMMHNEIVTEKMDEVIQETFDKRIEHEITRIMNGWGR